MKSTILISLLLFIYNYSTGQALEGWHLKDKSDKEFTGASIPGETDQFLRGKSLSPVIVAVIDGGTDPGHPDLRANLWTNPGETANNGLDDDGNGYVDDVHGWNFLGSPDTNLQYDNMEVVRIYRKLHPRFEAGAGSVKSAADKKDYKLYLEVKKELQSELTDAVTNLLVYEQIRNYLGKMQKDTGMEEPGAEDLMNIKSDDEAYNQTRMAIAASLDESTTFKVIVDEVDEIHKYFSTAVNYHYNTRFEPRELVNDNYNDYSERVYGNHDVLGPDGLHGTHVAGIIGAVRNNGTGIDGIAPAVRLMILRAVPDGDERDKDVANAIRYAADHGARIINMSFGKGYSPGKKYVDEAVRYAAAKDILFVHAAGNESADRNKKVRYPNSRYESDGKTESRWIEVGASTPSGQAAPFSNYGSKTVDLFAPGQSIYSTVPDGKYEFQDGTSMAAPVVSGIAALVWSAYPHLTAQQVKAVILASAKRVNYKTPIPGSGKMKKFSRLSITGGIVDAREALRLAGLIPH
jgi:cell wall-associated protease